VKPLPNFFLRQIVLIKLDLPTFDFPTKATWGKNIFGNWLGFAAPAINLASCLNIFVPSSLAILIQLIYVKLLNY